MCIFYVCTKLTFICAHVNICFDAEHTKCPSAVVKEVQHYFSASSCWNSSPGFTQATLLLVASKPSRNSFTQPLLTLLGDSVLNEVLWFQSDLFHSGVITVTSLQMLLCLPPVWHHLLRLMTCLMLPIWQLLSDRCLREVGPFVVFSGRVAWKAEVALESGGTNHFCVMFVHSNTPAVFMDALWMTVHLTCWGPSSPDDTQIK